MQLVFKYETTLFITYKSENTPMWRFDTYGGFFRLRFSQKCFQPESIILIVSLSKALPSVSSLLPPRFDTRVAL